MVMEILVQQPSEASFYNAIRSGAKSPIANVKSSARREPIKASDAYSVTTETPLILLLFFNVISKLLI